MQHLLNATSTNVGVASSSKYGSFIKLRDKLDRLLFSGTKVIVPLSILSASLAVFMDYSIYLVIFNRILLISALLLLAYIVTGRMALNIYKQEFLKTNKLQEFYDNDSTFGTFVFTNNISTLKAKRGVIGGSIYNVVKNVEVLVDNDYFDVDVYFKGHSLDNIHAYKGVMLDISGRPVLIVDGKLSV